MVLPLARLDVKVQCWNSVNECVSDNTKILVDNCLRTF